jgi:hypothetical protein
MWRGVPASVFMAPPLGCWSWSFQPDLPIRGRDLRPFKASCLLLAHSRLSQEPNDPACHWRRTEHEPVNRLRDGIGGARGRLADMALREVPDGIGLDVIPRHRARTQTTERGQISPHGRTFRPGLHAGARTTRQSTTGDLVQVQCAERGTQLAEAGAIPPLSPWLHCWQVIAGEPFQRLFIGVAG